MGRGRRLRVRSGAHSVRIGSSRPAGCGIVQDRRHRYLLASAAWDKGIAPAEPEVLLVDGIRWGSVGPLLFISLAIMGSPGPATISLMAAGSRYRAGPSPSDPVCLL